MPPRAHALLSASSSHRWLACPPSVMLSKGIPEEPSTYAAEGTDAHALCEYKLRNALGLPAEDPTKTLTFYNAQMDDCSTEYATYVIEKVNEAKQTCSDPRVLIEQQLDFSQYVPDGFGTGDCLVISDDTLRIVDFKYGQGVPVDATKNPQMMCYAIGAVELFDDLYDFDDVSMTIFQPRISNISEYTMTKADLLSWAEGTLAPIAQQAIKGEGRFAAGTWCRFCRAKAICRERARANLQLAQYEFQPPQLLTDNEISDILKGLDDLTSWADDVKQFALASALNGKQWDGFKLVEGRAVRKYTDEEAAAKAVEAAGYNPYEQKLLGITAMTAMLGKKTFNDLLARFTEKPAGKPALVPESDKRPAIQILSEFQKEDV